MTAQHPDVDPDLLAAARSNRPTRRSRARDPGAGPRGRTRISDRWQSRREDSDLRRLLIRELSETAGALYMATQHYARVARDEARSDDARLLARTKMDDVYISTRTVGDALEYQLAAYFLSTEPSDLWHSMMDLLTVRYFVLADYATDQFLAEQAGARHTRLSVDGLRDPDAVVAKYKECFRQLPRAVLSARRREF